MTQFVTSKDGTRIAYDKRGGGPPLVVVNGAMGVRSFKFSRQMAEELAKHFTVYDYDRRGRGDSTDTPPFAVAREVADLASMCKAAGGKPFVIGFSSGAGLALEAAAAGVPMQGLAVYEPPYVTEGHVGPGEAYTEHVTKLAAENKRDEAVEFFMRTVGVPGLMVFVMRRMSMWKTMRGVAHTLPYDAQAMGGGTFKPPTARLAKIKVQTWALAGGKTTPMLKAGAQAVADAVPGATFELIPKQTHAVKPAALAPVLARLTAPKQ